MAFGGTSKGHGSTFRKQKPSNCRLVHNGYGISKNYPPTLSHRCSFGTEKFKLDESNNVIGVALDLDHLSGPQISFFLNGLPCKYDSASLAKGLKTLGKQEQKKRSNFERAPGLGFGMLRDSIPLHVSLFPVISFNAGVVSVNLGHKPFIYKHKPFSRSETLAGHTLDVYKPLLDANCSAANHHPLDSTSDIGCLPSCVDESPSTFEPNSCMDGFWLIRDSWNSKEKGTVLVIRNGVANDFIFGGERGEISFHIDDVKIISFNTFATSGNFASIRTENYFLERKVGEAFRNSVTKILADASLGTQIRFNVKAKIFYAPLCSEGCKLTVQSYKEGAYRSGYVCNACHKNCEGGSERWFCLTHSHDVCFECCPKNGIAQMDLPKNESSNSFEVIQVDSTKQPSQRSLMLERVDKSTALLHSKFGKAKWWCTF
jgi:hypothetical protein